MHGDRLGDGRVTEIFDEVRGGYVQRGPAVRVGGRFWRLESQAEQADDGSTIRVGHGCQSSKRVSLSVIAGPHLIREPRDPLKLALKRPVTVADDPGHPDRADKRVVLAVPEPGEQVCYDLCSLVEAIP